MKMTDLVSIEGLDHRLYGIKVSAYVVWEETSWSTAKKRRETGWSVVWGNYPFLFNTSEPQLHKGQWDERHETPHWQVLARAQRLAATHKPPISLPHKHTQRQVRRARTDNELLHAAARFVYPASLPPNTYAMPQRLCGYTDLRYRDTMTRFSSLWWIKYFLWEERICQGAFDSRCFSSSSSSPFLPWGKEYWNAVLVSGGIKPSTLRFHARVASVCSLWEHGCRSGLLDESDTVRDYTVSFIFITRSGTNSIRTNKPSSPISPHRPGNHHYRSSNRARVKTSSSRQLI